MRYWPWAQLPLPICSPKNLMEVECQLLGNIAYEENCPWLVNCIWLGRTVNIWLEAIALGFLSVMTFVTRHVPCENSGIFVYGAIIRDNSFNLEDEASELERLHTCPRSPELSCCMPVGIAPVQWYRPLQGLPLSRNACCCSSGIVFSVLSPGWIQSQIGLCWVSLKISHRHCTE